MFSLNELYMCKWGERSKNVNVIIYQREMLNIWKCLNSNLSYHNSFFSLPQVCTQYRIKSVIQLIMEERA